MKMTTNSASPRHSTLRFVDPKFHPSAITENDEEKRNKNTLVTQLVTERGEKESEGETQ